jgi:hypothetical protein
LDFDPHSEGCVCQIDQADSCWLYGEEEEEEEKKRGETEVRMMMVVCNLLYLQVVVEVLEVPRDLMGVG